MIWRRHREQGLDLEKRLLLQTFCLLRSVELDSREPLCRTSLRTPMDADGEAHLLHDDRILVLIHALDSKQEARLHALLSALLPRHLEDLRL
eukprot:CAMPEP_0195073202 /NCGR_PEP_ID=MMETSP0448-20130528/16591_1 /TAXON_ID=66468 /ORGANISM="Heterocapsa triquestra, Strain CCMP 448" /LENGTH=91 /DNA_ID=CAMNT_0040105279 /DNA_START=12 /DNA_END=284 /DNA_ORIENTATION=-